MIARHIATAPRDGAVIEPPKQAPDLPDRYEVVRLPMPAAQGVKTKKPAGVAPGGLSPTKETRSMCPQRRNAALTVAREAGLKF